jgi:hypothetical protein
MKSYENPMGLWMVYGNLQLFPYEIAILGDQSPKGFWISTQLEAPAVMELRHRRRRFWARRLHFAQLETNGYHGFLQVKMVKKE